jgi:hypothetical protein
LQPSLSLDHLWRSIPAWILTHTHICFLPSALTDFSYSVRKSLSMMKKLSLRKVDWLPQMSQVAEKAGPVHVFTFLPRLSFLDHSSFSNKLSPRQGTDSIQKIFSSCVFMPLWLDQSSYHILILSKWHQRKLRNWLSLTLCALPSQSMSNFSSEFHLLLGIFLIHSIFTSPLQLSNLEVCS